MISFNFPSKLVEVELKVFEDRLLIVLEQSHDRLVGLQSKLLEEQLRDQDADVVELVNLTFNIQVLKNIVKDNLTLRSETK